MVAISPHTTRATGTILTAVIYNGDHANHIANAMALNNAKVEGPGVPVVDGHLALFDGNSGTLVKDGGAPLTSVGTGDLQNDSVTFAKMQNIGTDKLIGRDTAGTGDPEEIGVGGGLTFNGSQGITMLDNGTTNARLADMANRTVKGRVTTGTGDPEDVNMAGLKFMMGIKAVTWDGTTAANLTGTYTRVGTLVTVTTPTPHGQLNGHVVYLDFTSGAAADIIALVVTVIDANNFTINHVTSGTTSGNVTILRRQILHSNGVANIAYLNSAGDFGINFDSFYTGTEFTLAGWAMDSDGTGDVYVSAPAGSPFTGSACRVYVRDSGGGAVASTRCSLIIVGNP